MAVCLWWRKGLLVIGQPLLYMRPSVKCRLSDTSPHWNHISRLHVWKSRLSVYLYNMSNAQNTNNDMENFKAKLSGLKSANTKELSRVKEYSPIYKVAKLYREAMNHCRNYNDLDQIGKVWLLLANNNFQGGWIIEGCESDLHSFILSKN